jgi:NitT/TauT family transport system ATP-binding protein
MTTWRHMGGPEYRRCGLVRRQARVMMTSRAIPVARRPRLFARAKIDRARKDVDQYVGSHSGLKATQSPAILADHVSMTFRAQGKLTTALSEVSLSVEPGEFISLLGPSGCGKSTLLRLIGDLLRPSAGSLTVKGKSPARARSDRDYGIVFQAPVLYDWRTVVKNVQLPLEIFGVPRPERASRTAELIKLMGLQDFAGSYPWQLSGGMQQRVAIARALSFRPSILLMDEPFGALDEMTRERLNMELLTIWRQTGTTIIFVTHSIAEAIFLSTRVVVMTPRPGKIERIITVDLPQPRDATTRETPRFFEYVTEVRGCLREGHVL